MKITIKNLPEQVELIKKMGSKNRLEAEAAKEAFAALLSPTLGYVLNEADTTKLVYRDLVYNENDEPSLPLELFLGVNEGHFSVWSQSQAGGLPTNNVYEPIDEVKFSTYRLDSAISYLRKYAQQTRLDVIGKSLERMMQEILLKLNRNSWTVLLGSLASANNQNRQSVILTQEAQSGGGGTQGSGSAQGKITLDDINKLFTLIKRQNESFAGGTPATTYGQLTDLVISVELMEYIRTMAYNPINTRSAVGAGNVSGGLTNTNSATVTMPDSVRAEAFAGGGIQSLLGVNLIEMVELGVNQKYTVLFNQLANSAGQTYNNYAGNVSGGAVAFGAGNDLAIGLNLAGNDFAFRAIEQDLDTGSTFTLQPDDQFSARSERIGFYGSMRVGHLITSTRELVGLII
jgi:hypothetical protein